VLPSAVRALREPGVEVPRILGDFFSEPRRFRETLTLRLQFDFRNDQTSVLSQELVHFPDHPTFADAPSNLFDDGPFAKPQKLFSVGGRDLVFELGP
jgi:hypothetical protein